MSCYASVLIAALCDIRYHVGIYLIHGTPYHLILIFLRQVFGKVYEPPLNECVVFGRAGHAHPSLRNICSVPVLKWVSTAAAW